MYQSESTESPGSGCGSPALESSQWGPAMVVVKLEGEDGEENGVMVKEEEEKELFVKEEDEGEDVMQKGVMVDEEDGGEEMREEGVMAKEEVEVEVEIEEMDVPLQHAPKKAKGLGWNILPVPQWRGSLPKATGIKSPIEYFRDNLLTKTCVENMVDQTNLYAVQCDPGQPLNATCCEIEQFLGICFYMSIYGLPASRMYWNSTTRVDCVADTMTMHRWKAIKRNVHLADNTQLIPRGQPGHDRLHKVRPLLTSLLESFQAIPMDERLCVDEQVVSFKGKSGHMMDFTLVNAWLLYRRDCEDCGVPKKDVYSLLRFKAEVASCLCNERKVLKKRGRSSQDVEGDPAEKKCRGPASSVPSASVRQDNTDHWPVWVEKKGRCKYPGCKGIVKVQCSKCVTYLCFTPEKNCFMNFHKQ